MTTAKTILEWRAALQEGLTPEAVVREVMGRIATWDDPALFIHLPEESVLMAEAARVAGLARDLPLWGVPFVVKDNIDVGGWPTTAGCPDFAYTPAEDATVVARLRAAGALLIGKTNLDQFATGLVGTRSPFGVARNAFDAAYLPGGSSSGSASAVAAGIAAFSLGTDTAGSGRVPAAFQELIGWKPTRGRLSARGVVPACRSLDCVSVFTRTAADAAVVLGVASWYDEADAFSVKVVDAPLGREAFRFGVPKDLDFAGDADTPGLFSGAVARMKALGGVAVEVDLTPFVEAAKLLYEGPWVAERWAAVGDFVTAKPESVHPVTREILEGSKGWDAATTFRAQYRLRELARQTEAVWQGIELLLLPTTPRLYTVEEVLNEPFGTNATLGRYTNFMNLLDLCAVAVPAGRARDGMLPWGVTLAAPAGRDLALLALAARMTGNEVVPEPKPELIPVAVCGAHLAGLALHHQLADRGAVLKWKGETTAAYRLYAMPGGGGLPPRPALVRDDTGAGAGIAVEVWELKPAEFGTFVAGIPAPLGIGKVELATGEQVPGFIAEPRAVSGAEEITRFRGWRAWLAR